MVTNHATDLLPLNLVSPKMFLQLFYFVPLTVFFSVLLPLFKVCGDVLLPLNSKGANILVLIFDMFSMFCCE